MKFSKLFCTIPLITTALGFSTVSCASNKYKIPKITQQILDEFMGNAKKGITGIVNIPRPSHHCLAIQQYVYDIAKDNLPANSEIYADTFNNVYYTIPASEGCENWKAIALQAHMDMVVDGLTEEQALVTKIQPVIEEIQESLVIHSKDWKTSLGADDGIGLSMLLWITKNYNSFKHGAIRIICTADEETGSLGAHNLTEEALKYNGATIKYLINLDEEGRYGIARSCTGTLMENFYHTYGSAKNDDICGPAYDIKVGGLKGGHSAFDILKKHANADRLLFEFINHLIVSGKQVQLISYDHKNEVDDDVAWAANALIQNGHIRFYCSEESEETIEGAFNECLGIWKSSYDDDFSTWIPQNVIVKDESITDVPFLSVTDTQNVAQMLGSNKIDPLSSVPDIGTNGFLYGISEDNEKLKGVPKGSFNVGPVKLTGNDTMGTLDFEVDTCLRSSVRSGPGEPWTDWSINWIKDGYEDFAKNIWSDDFDPKEDIEEINKFEPWVFNGDNKLVDFLENSYKELGCNPILIDPPAFLEVAEWARKVPPYSNAKFASIGVELNDVHTTKEKVHIDTIENCFKVLLKAIAWMEEA